MAHELNWVKGAFSKSTTYSANCIQSQRSKNLNHRWKFKHNRYRCYAPLPRALSKETRPDFPDFPIHVPFGYVVVESSWLKVHRYFLFPFNRRPVTQFKAKLNCKWENPWVIFFLKKDGKSKREEVIMAFLNTLTPREDASAIHSSSFGRNEWKMR